MENSHALYQPFQLGNLNLKNRIIVAPMTRSRAKEGNVSGDLAPEYYKQRATSGLIISEATQVSTKGIGYINTPGIYTEEQVIGWQQVTNAVHEAGGLIFLQLWHVGRVSHPDFHNGDLPIGPSAIKPAGEVYTFEGQKPMETPRALALNEIPEVVKQFRTGAELAKKAGFDGVEIHGANGYLVDQFLRDGSNQRNDEYGGSIENRAKFLLEVTQAAIDVFGAERVGVRLSPTGTFNNMKDSNPEEAFTYASQKLGEMNIAFLHVVESPKDPAAEGQVIRDISAKMRDAFNGVFMVNGGYTKERAEKAIEQNEADLVSIGQAYLANPDLPQRFMQNAPLNEPDFKTFYGGGAKGYTDYPTLEEANA
ncbi:MAG: alkene reductase [Bacteroidota bacterium]